MIPVTHQNVQAVDHSELISPWTKWPLFTDDIFKYIFVKGKFCALIKISPKFVPKGPIDNKPAWVKIMAWRWIGDEPLSEPIQTRFTDIYMQH